MCLPDFIEFREIDKSTPLIGYRNWKLTIKDNVLKSESMDYYWNKIIEGPHEIKNFDSGIYAYNNNHYDNNNHYNYYNDYYYHNNYYNHCNNYYNHCNNNNHYNNYNDYYNDYNNHYNNYHISGSINQWGKTAIHQNGQRSEFAKINTLYLIKESDAEGPKEFIKWIKQFNQQIKELAIRFECQTVNYQNFILNKVK